MIIVNIIFYILKVRNIFKISYHKKMYNCVVMNVK